MPTDKNNREPTSRLEYRQLKGLPISLPKLKNSQHILDHINEVGLSKAGMSGILPVDWSDIESWVKLTHTVLETWEAKLLMTISREYCYQFNSSSAIDCPAPYKTVITEDEMLAVREKADATIRGLF